MAKEIERKFLVRGDDYKRDARRRYVKQGYLCFDPDKTVRVRVTEDEGAREGFLTVKGRNEGLERTEFEYAISYEDAEAMLVTMVAPETVIEKYRWLVTYDGKLWEVDEFLGAHAGLVLAEIELSASDEAVTLPDWVGDEVSGDERYYNSNLARRKADGT